MRDSVSILQAEKVAFQYPQHGQGLCPTSLALHPGEATLITGASGCGKSTLARCLTGIIPRPYRGNLSGTVWLDGLDTRRTAMRPPMPGDLIRLAAALTNT